MDFSSKRMVLALHCHSQPLPSSPCQPSGFPFDPGTSVPCYAVYRIGGQDSGWPRQGSTIFCLTHGFGLWGELKPQCISCTTFAID